MREDIDHPDVINTERTGYPSEHKKSRLGTAIPKAAYIKKHYYNNTDYSIKSQGGMN